MGAALAAKQEKPQTIKNAAARVSPSGMKDLEQGACGLLGRLRANLKLDGETDIEGEDYGPKILKDMTM
ncbi:MAG: hypothetical protein ACO3G9_10770 [Chthoniobacterales bacterium]